MHLAPNSYKSLKNKDEYDQKIVFLGRIADGCFIIFGIALVLTGIARFLNIYGSPLSAPQIAQSLLGLLLFMVGFFRKVTSLLKTYQRTHANNFKRALGVLPFICFSIFVVYRVQLEDLKGYKRLVEEGSLVEWLTFLFLLFAALLFFIIGTKELNKLVAKFVLATSGLVFVLSMEEISWGQMIFNWRSPDFLAKLNSQQETNIHNFILISGEPNTLIIALVLLSLSIFCVLRWYLVSNYKIKANTLADLIFPPLFLIGYFSLGAFVYLGLILQMKGIEVPILIPSDQELVECFFGLGVLIHSCRLYINWGHDLNPTERITPLN